MSEGDDPDAGEERAEIPAPFDALPVLEDPAVEDRRHARLCFPRVAVPETGPIPDPHHRHTVTREVTVPEWALAAAVWWGRSRPPAERTREWARAVLMDRVEVSPEFVTPDGRDAAEAALARLEDDGEGSDR